MLYRACLTMRGVTTFGVHLEKSLADWNKPQNAFTQAVARLAPKRRYTPWHGLEKVWNDEAQQQAMFNDLLAKALRPIPQALVRWQAFDETAFRRDALDTMATLPEANRERWQEFFAPDVVLSLPRLEPCSCAFRIAVGKGGKIMAASLIVDENDCEEPAPGRKRWTREECARLVKMGLLTGRYELIEGEIISKMGQNRPHIHTIIRLVAWLLRVFGEEYIQSQGDIDVADPDNPINEPQPDGAALARPLSEFSKNNPGPSDLLLVIEVSDSTLRYDMKTKARVYGRAGIREYWVLDLNNRKLIAHRDPQATGYKTVTEHAETDTVAPLSRPDALTRVADLLPPVTAK